MIPGATPPPCLFDGTHGERFSLSFWAGALPLPTVMEGFRVRLAYPQQRITLPTGRIITRFVDSPPAILIYGYSIYVDRGKQAGCIVFHVNHTKGSTPLADALKYICQECKLTIASFHRIPNAFGTHIEQVSGNPLTPNQGFSSLDTSALKKDPCWLVFSANGVPFFSKTRPTSEGEENVSPANGPATIVSSPPQTPASGNPTMAPPKPVSNEEEELLAALGSPVDAPATVNATAPASEPRNRRKVPPHEAQQRRTPDQYLKFLEK